jgi:putative phage-type endonuclease
MLSPKRIGRVTGSAAGAILGLSPHMTPDDALRRMVRDYHGAEPEFTGNVATQYGQFHEQHAVVDLLMEHAIDVELSSVFYEYEDWLGATPDGFCRDYVVEIKCPYSQRDKKHPEFKPIAAMQHYHAQTQVEMICTGKDKCMFIQWAPSGMDIQVVKKDDDWLRENLPLLKSFHERYLSELDNPAHLEPKIVELTSLDALRIAREYDELTDIIDNATARKKDLLDELVLLAKGRNCSVNGKKLTQVEREGAISYAKALKKYAPDADLEPFRGKPTKYWRFS